MIISKGVLFLLDALRILHERGCEFECDYIGGETVEINATVFTEEVHKRQLDGLVKYHGPKVGQEKIKFLHTADIFAFPTFYHNECFPLVLLEAMQQRLPIVTTCEGAIPDIVKDAENGYLCERNNSQSLADCIQKLLEDESLRIKFGECGFEKYTEEYTIQTFEKRIIKILKIN